MRVALVHELLTMRGGAERVLRVFANMFPDAPIYTLLYDEKRLGEWFPKERVRTSRVQSTVNFLRHSPFSSRACRGIHSPFDHHLYLSRFPAAVEAWPFDAAQGDSPHYDLVISSSSAFAHGIITNGKPPHLCYVQSPARYLWDRTHDVLERAGKGMLGPLRRWHLSRTFHKLRIWDSEAADRPDTLIAASKEVKRRIELYWRRDAEVIHPPIDDFWLQPFNHSTITTLDHLTIRPSDHSYYLIVSQLAQYKRIELAIHACNARKAKLIIAGEGPARRSLEVIAGPTVEFVGYRTDAEVKDLYTNARGTLFPGEEDFGLVPLESLACGTPVIAYRSGGATETLTENTAEFFDAPDAASLADAMGRFEAKQWDRERCRTRARDFSEKRFVDSMHKSIARLMKGDTLIA